MMASFDGKALLYLIAIAFVVIWYRASRPTAPPAEFRHHELEVDNTLDTVYCRACGDWEYFHDADLLEAFECPGRPVYAEDLETF